MRIETSHTCDDGSIYVSGYVDYDGSGYESDVIILSVEGGVVKVNSSMWLPTKYEPAKLVLACFNEAFIKAESIASEAENDQ